MIKLKNETEIGYIRESCRLLETTHREIAKLIEPGITTRELDDFARDYIVRHGGKPAFLNYAGYPASLCVSVNDEVIHGIPGKRKLMSGDLVSLDLGINLRGYISDAARSYGVGKISVETADLIKTTKECLVRGIEKATAGNRIRHISNALYEHATGRGYGVVTQYCGHGVGFEVHEDPQIPNYPFRGHNPRIRPGMVLAIEPMINLGTGDVDVLDDDWTVVTADGKISAHQEHTVAVFEDHTEILTTID